MKRKTIIHCPHSSDKKETLLKKAEAEGWKVETSEQGIAIHAEVELTEEQAKLVNNGSGVSYPMGVDLGSREPGKSTAIVAQALKDGKIVVVDATVGEPPVLPSLTGNSVLREFIKCTELKPAFKSVKSGKPYTPSKQPFYKKFGR